METLLGSGEAKQRAINLFEFLSRAQRLKSRPVKSIESYRGDGQEVIWFAELPDHPAVQVLAAPASAEPDEPLLTVDRIARHDPRQPPDEIRLWLEPTSYDDPETEPALRDWILEFDDGDPDAEPVRKTIDESPSARAAYEGWLTDWQAWAEDELLNRPARDLYNQLFGIRVAAETHIEELELCFGAALCGWSSEDGSPIRRHVFTTSLSIDFNDETGQLSVSATNGSLDVETEMFDSASIAHVSGLAQIKDEAKAFEYSVLDPDTIGQLARRLVLAVDPESQYDDEFTPVESSTRLRASFAPALLLRKRSQRGLIRVLDEIVDQLKAADEVPSGILALVNPDAPAEVELDDTPGASVDVDGEIFLPLPVNERQLEVLRRVDRRARTLVQGPPGTGKTHTSAALISHLLAQGKRVLVTAHTDRALYEVRDKLPAAIRPLSVSVVGGGRDDMAQLRTAVDTISGNAAEFDPKQSRNQESHLLSEIDGLKRTRAELYRRLLELRHLEVEPHERKGQSATLAAHAWTNAHDEAQFGWISAEDSIANGMPAPLSNAEALELLALLRDANLIADEPESRLTLEDLAQIPAPEEFHSLTQLESDRSHGVASFGGLAAADAIDGVRQLPRPERLALQNRLRHIADAAEELANRREIWIENALQDVLAGRGGLWAQREDQIRSLIEPARQLVAELGPLVVVTFGEGDRHMFGALAGALRAHVRSGKEIKTTAGGLPKVGPLSARVLKDAQPFFDSIRVNGLPPTNDVSLGQVETALEIQRVLGALEKAWPSNVTVPEEDTYGEQLQWHVTELQQLVAVMDLSGRLQAESEWMKSQGLRVPDWSDLHAVIEFSRLVDLVGAEEALGETAGAFAGLLATLDATAAVASTPQCHAQMRDAVEHRDAATYSDAHRRLARLHQAKAEAARRDTLHHRLSKPCPNLALSLAATPTDAVWTQRLGEFEDAWAWAETASWIRSHEPDDANALQAELANVEDALRSTIEKLAANRAWGHALAPSRMTGQTRADLAHYVQLVRQLGKGTGKYAAKRRAEIRDAMDQCRPAVPVWIMPIYRVVDQLEISPNMFDVVIVDEASQAGMEATFLQYIAPKIVVVGDDQQVSPSGVGLDQQELRDLAQQFLAEDRYKSSWQDPGFSFFDAAVKYFGDRVTLVEHRRCMPEIIAFSNKIVYEPQNMRLIPVRQFGADRLEPVKAVHVPDGYEVGRSNPAEAEAIVDQIEKCFTDPAYDGKTFGVISLLGGEQAKKIQNLLLDRVGPEELEARNVRCGDSTDFQGSERDVMFLSMVKAPDPGRRIAAQTRRDVVQRYNVAASRAKDQMWVFHSMAAQELSGNSEDMRTALLEHCYSTMAQAAAAQDDGTIGTVPDDIRTVPFDSLFEQRVFNRIRERGYFVTPQWPEQGYRIDLVVQGSKGRLAVECDGDFWHGRDAYENDLGRQRDLERCGWRFFRIRESEFYVDQEEILGRLWAKLDELEIRPMGWEPEQAPTAVPEESPVVPSPLPQSQPAPMGSAPEIQSAPEVEFETEPPGPEPQTDPAIRAPAINLDRSDQATQQLTPYSEFRGILGVVGVADRPEIVAGLIDIVSVEGPIVGTHLYRRYVVASGGSRVGRSIASELNKAVHAALRNGLLVADAPLGESLMADRTYRLPDQPEWILRTLGNRDLELVPPLELAQLAERVTSSSAVSDFEPIARGILAELGLKRLTSGVESRLRDVLMLIGQGFDSSTDPGTV